MLLEEISEFDEASEIAGRIHAAFTQPFVVAEHELFLTCSIGVAASDSLGEWGERLIARADAAVYAAKSSGRNRVHLAQPLVA